MTKFKKIFLSITGLFIFACLPLAHAQQMSGDEATERKQFEHHIQDIYERLNLTDEQKKQLGENKKQTRAKMMELRQQMKSAKDAIRLELMKPQLDMALVQGLHARIKGLQSQTEDSKLNSILTVRSILSPEQFTKFVSLMHQHKKEHEE